MFEKPMDKKSYTEAVASDREARMLWWKKARFGMFVHYGPYAVSGQQEWYMAYSGMDAGTYEREITSKFHPRPGCAREWAQLAKSAGCKYMVMTTRHHDGYSMWDSEANPYNVVKFGGDYDVVREFTEACREAGLGVGFYHSVMDWHDPDCAAATRDLKARSRFIEYHRAMLRELMTNYGKIDILWYDMSEPLGGETLDFVNLSREVRRLQPGIIINSRAGVPEDIDNPEDKLGGAADVRWEACMTFNRLSWGYVNEREAVPYSFTAQQIIKMLAECTRDGGNLLLNIGPKPDGSVPADAAGPLKAAGKWLGKYGEAVYGLRLRQDAWVPSGCATADSENVYAVSYIAPPLGYLIFNGAAGEVESAVCLTDGRPCGFEQKGRIVRIFTGPERTDPVAGITVYRVHYKNSTPDLIRATRRVMPPALSCVWG